MALPPLVDRGISQAGNDVGVGSGAMVDVDEPIESTDFMENADGELEAMPEGAEVEVDAPYDHEANLAEALGEVELGALASELVADYEDDLVSRKEWEETYAKGLDLLGVEYEERSEPFEGASGVTHPLIAESVVQFQAQAYKELLPAGGPVRTRIIGAKTDEAEQQADRVKHFMNYQITEVIEDYDPGLDQLLFYLPLSGSTFKKVYYDVLKGRAASDFIPGQDLVVPYSATDLQTSTRYTHRLVMSDNEVRKLQVAGVYRDVSLTVGRGEDDKTEVKKKVDEIEGLEPSMSSEDRLILEMHVELDLEGFEDIDPTSGEPSGIKLPYIVTVDHDSNTILSIRRNWEENDPLRRKRAYFVHYKFLPGLGFYGFGLIHLIGGLGRAATALLRQLIDAGTFSNMPGGFKAKGVRLQNYDEPIKPGEFRDIDTPGGNLRDSIIPLPYKEPSGTLASLLGGLIDAGRRFVSVADQKTEGMTNSEAPVGTTVALLERGTRVMSAIHKRLHYAQKTEFRLLAKVFAKNLPPYYPYEIAGAPQQIKQSDFDGRVDIIPVSDPNIFSMAQRIALAQNQLQLAQTNPQMHNLHEAYKRMYQALEVQNIEEILPPPPQPQPKDPATENAEIVAGAQAQAFPQQDHEAHVLSHITLSKSSLIKQTPPVMAAIQAHCFQHIAHWARERVQQEVQQLQQQEIQQIQMLIQTGAIDPQIGMQRMQVVQQGGGQFSPEQIEARVAQVQQELTSWLIQQLNPAPGEEEDPLVRIRQQELALKGQKQEFDAQVDQEKLALDRDKLQQAAQTDAARMELQEEIAEERNEVNRERIEATLDMAEMRNRGD